MNTEISRYLVDENGNSFSSDSDLKNLASDSKVKNINSGLAYKKVSGTEVPVFEIKSDNVLCSPQVLSSSEKAQARQNIGASSQSDAITQVSSDVTKLYFKSQDGTVKATVDKTNFPNLYCRYQPSIQDVLWSGDSNQGDLRLAHSFENYDALMFVYSLADKSQGTGATWSYNVVPSWILWKVIIERDFYNLGERYFNICRDDAYWNTDVANSSTTLLKHNKDNELHMWKIVGLNFTMYPGNKLVENNTVNPWGEHWRVKQFETFSTDVTGTDVYETQARMTIGQGIDAGAIVREYHISYLHYATPTTTVLITRCYYVWKSQFYDLTSEDKAQINSLTDNLPDSYMVTYDSGDSDTSEDSSSSSSSSSQTWGVTKFNTVNSDVGQPTMSVGQTVSEGKIVRIYALTHWTQTNQSTWDGLSYTDWYYVWKDNNYTLTNADKSKINSLPSSSSYSIESNALPHVTLSYNSGNI